MTMRIRGGELRCRYLTASPCWDRTASENRDGGSVWPPPTALHTRPITTEKGAANCGQVGVANQQRNPCRAKTHQPRG